MKYVPDVSVAMCSVLPRPHTAKAQVLLAAYRQQLHELIAPSVFPTEAANGLTKSERQKLIPVGQALVLVDEILRTPPLLYDALPLLRRATDISSRTRSGFYDCLYVALSEREGCELVTDDDKFAKNLQPHFPFIIPLSSLP